MNREVIINFVLENKGKVFGVFIGLMFSVLTLLIGLFKTVFIVICTILGYYIGKKIDNNEDIIELVQKILSNEWK